jgi:cytokinesis protein
MPGMAGMAGVLAGIKGGGFKLKGAAAKSTTPSPPAPPPPPPIANVAGRAPLAPLSALLHGVNDSRKEVAHMASRKMKQLQWEKVSKAQLAKTVWGDAEDVDGLTGKAPSLWAEMEDEFKAKEILHDAVKKKKETELQSVLSPDHRKHIGILMAGTTAKSFNKPEVLSEAIAHFNAALCTETFLRELQGVLPNDDDVSLSSARGS